MAEKAGGALFAAAPEFAVDYSMANGSTTISINVDEQGDANLRLIDLAYDAPNLADCRRYALGMRYVSSGSPAQITMNGLTISLNGQAQTGDVPSVSGEFPRLAVSLRLLKIRRHWLLATCFECPKALRTSVIPVPAFASLTMQLPKAPSPIWTRCW